MKPSVSLAKRQAFRTESPLAFCFNLRMTPKESMIQRLKALCTTHGVDVVAYEAHVSADNLRQIVAGTKLESGAPRGVGPNLQRKLEARYPGWAEQATTGASGSRVPGNRFEDRHEVSDSDWGTLQAVKAMLPERDLQDIRDRHAKLKQQVIEEISNMSDRSRKVEK